MKRIFLGGTCAESTWRDELIVQLNLDKYTFFNPIVKDWNEECKAIEVQERKDCDIVLYTITPEMRGVYSIAEATDDSNKRPKNTVLCLIREVDSISFDDQSWNSMLEVGRLIGSNGSHILYGMDELIEYFKK
jgi:hypothetical protein